MCCSTQYCFNRHLIGGSQALVSCSYQQQFSSQPHVVSTPRDCCCTHSNSQQYVYHSHTTLTYTYCSYCIGRFARFSSQQQKRLQAFSSAQQTKRFPFNQADHKYVSTAHPTAQVAGSFSAYKVTIRFNPYFNPNEWLPVLLLYAQGLFDRFTSHFFVSLTCSCLLCLCLRCSYKHGVRRLLWLEESVGLCWIRRKLF